VQNLALELTFGDAKKQTGRRDHAQDIALFESTKQDIYIFYYGNLFAQYQRGDNYSRNLIMVQLYLCHGVAQKTLSELFQLTIPHLSRMIGNYRRSGSVGIEDHTAIRIGNNQKIKGKVAEHIINQLEGEEQDRPTYGGVSKSIKRKWRIDISAHRIGCWWRQYKKEQQPAKEPKEAKKESTQIPLFAVEQTQVQSTKQPEEQCIAARQDSEGRDQVGAELIEKQWQPNNVAGSFILYVMLAKSHFLDPFIKGIKGVWNKGKDSVERVTLTLFFSHALRLKSIEQTKHLLSTHFGPLVLGTFHRQQPLRYAIDKITSHKNFDKAVLEHYKNLSRHTELGDGIYYTDGHFSNYYGKYAVPKGYDARKQQPARGRNTIYLHNSLGHNILSFESPTHTTLSVDIVTLIGEMKKIFSEVKGKNLFFDRGGFSADCFKKIKKAEMYFTTYLKYRKKQAEIDETLFEEVTINIHGAMVKNQIYETVKQSRTYGELRTIIFVGKQGKQIPVISTNPTLSAAEIVARLQKRWVEENGFKYMDEHFNIDLLTTYETEQAPDKIMSRPNPDRKASNKAIGEKKAALKELKQQYATKLTEVKNKDELTIAAFEEQETKLKWEIKNVEMELGLLELNRKDIPSKVETNMKDESVISCQKRRMFINLVKTMNYNCEKWLQLIFCQYHPKADETLSLIRHVLTQPGRIRQRGQILEVELERLDSRIQANTLDKVLEKLKENNYLLFPDGRKLAIWQKSA